MNQIKAYTLISKLFTNAVGLIQDLENTKRRASLHKDFEPYSIYASLDKDSKGYLNSNDLKAFLASHNSYSQSEDLPISLLIESLGSRYRDKLLYKDFLILILPLCFNLGRSITTQNEIKQVVANSPLSHKLELLLLLIISDYLRFIKALNSMRIDIYLEGVDLLEAFKFIDFGRDRHVCLLDLQRFLKCSCVDIPLKGLELMMSTLSIENKALRWSFEEFLCVCLPNRASCVVDDSILRDYIARFRDFYGSFFSDCVSTGSTLSSKPIIPKLDLSYLNTITSSTKGNKPREVVLRTTAKNRSRSMQFNDSCIKAVSKPIDTGVSNQDKKECKGHRNKAASKEPRLSSYNNTSYNFDYKAICTNPSHMDCFQISKNTDKSNSGDVDLKALSARCFQMLLSELNELLHLEQEIETERSKLAKNSSFDLETAYKSFSLYQKSFLVYEEFHNAIGKLNLHKSFSKNIIIKLFHYYDSTMSNKLNFGDFYEFFLPLKKNLFNSMLANVGKKPSDKSNSIVIYEAIQRLFRYMLISMKETTRIKATIHKEIHSLGSEAAEAVYAQMFTWLDLERKGFISIENVRIDLLLAWCCVQGVRHWFG